MGKIRVNDPIRLRELTTIQGERITIPASEFRTTFSFVDSRVTQAINLVGLSRQDGWKSQGDFNNA